MSGMGTFEFEHFRIRRAVAKVLGVTAGKNIYYSACDMDPAAQLVLAAHPEATRPQHIFTNLLDVIPDKDRKRLQAALDTNLQELLDAQKKLKARKITKAKLDLIKNRLSIKTLSELTGNSPRRRGPTPPSSQSSIMLIPHILHGVIHHF